MDAPNNLMPPEMEQRLRGLSSVAPKYLTPDEVVARLNNIVSKKTLANWRSNKDGPPYNKFGGRVLYPFDDLVAWEKARKFVCTGDYRAAQ